MKKKNNVHKLGTWRAKEHRGEEARCAPNDEDRGWKIQRPSAEKVPLKRKSSEKGCARNLVLWASRSMFVEDLQGLLGLSGDHRRKYAGRANKKKKIPG